jgi:acetoin utilization deacetylase AcuC-like enzyme
MTTALVADPFYKLHDPGPTHPERPERFDAVLAGVQREGLMPRLLRVPSRSATTDELTACHSSEYINLVKAEAAAAAGYAALSTGDTNICRDSFQIALQAAGGVLNAVDTVMEGRAQNAFCVVRPPGHHASRNRGMGFCIFNNVALGARRAQQRHGAARVLIADWDVHHGNGTQDLFYANGSIFFFSVHQYPWYPGTGREDENGTGPGIGTTLNCPLPAGSGREEILGAFQNLLAPAAEKFKPELVLVSAGFDSRLGDPLGRFTLSDEDFGDLTRIVLDIAHEHAEGRLVSVLEGGYNLSGLASAAATHVRVLCQAAGPRR